MSDSNDIPLPRWVPWLLYAGATLTLGGSGASAILAGWEPELLDGAGGSSVGSVGMGVHISCIAVAILGVALVSLAAFAILKKYFGPLGLSEEQAPRYIFATGLFMFLAGVIGTVSVAGLVRHGTLILEAPKDEELAVSVAQHRFSGATVGASRKDGTDADVDATSHAVVDPDAEPPSGQAADASLATDLDAGVGDASTDVEGPEPQPERTSPPSVGSPAPETPTDTPAAVSEAETLSDRHRLQCYYVLIAGSMAFIGAVFFVTNSVWRKRYSATRREPFSVPQFWAGFALRVGEAVVFNLAFVLLLACYSSSNSPFTYQYLPVLGLFTGMFVKSAEQVIFGIAQRMFEAVKVVIPPTTSESRTDARQRQGTSVEGPASPPSAGGGSGGAAGADASGSDDDADAGGGTGG